MRKLGERSDVYFYKVSGAAPVQGDDGENEHGCLAANCRQHTTYVTAPTVTPLAVTTQVASAIAQVVSGQHQQVHSHQQVSQGQVLGNKRCKIK